MKGYSAKVGGGKTATKNGAKGCPPTSRHAYRKGGRGGSRR